ncbi:hypothetical protein GCM10029992_29030 [Glycomyces albus]
MLMAASAAGLAAAGVKVVDLGVLPTPAVAHLTAVTGADFGVMISASHNPMPDNGIKFFAAGGRKLPDDVEDAIEAALDDPAPLPQGKDVGRIVTSEDPVETYIEHLVAAAPTDSTASRSSSTPPTAPPAWPPPRPCAAPAPR